MIRKKGTLKPITLNAPMERVQIDLVDMKSPLVTNRGQSSRYVLSIMEVFNGYVVLRALLDKTASAVADQLGDVLAIIGTPKILPCDQGTNFKGAL